MKKLIVLVSAIALALPAFVYSQSSNHLTISEIQVGASADSSAEFVELFNPLPEPISLEGWRLEYKSATSADNWLTKSELSAEIPAYGFYLIATDSFTNVDAALSPGLAQAGGHLRLVDGAGGIVDLVGWGSANASEGASAPVAPEDGSIERLPGEHDPEGGNWVDTDHNQADFRVRQSSDPQNSSAPAEEPDYSFVPPAATEPQPTTPAQVLITELLVDPVAPQTDADDEFIELHNPGSTVVNLSGYRIETGNSFSYSHSIENLELAPGSYVALPATQTGLTLSNSGGMARVLGPDGEELDRTPAYPKAEPGHSWADFREGWQWTATPTPGTPNILQTSQPAAQAAAKKTTKKKAAAKKKAASSRRGGGLRLASAKAARPPLSKGLQGEPAGKWLLAGLGGLTIAYAAYEFRYDLQNIYRITRRKLGVGG